MRKIRGGATVESGTQFESDFRIRARQDVGAKARMAQAAAALVEPGMTVLINDGSMAAVLAETLLDRRPLTVITNNAAVLDRLRVEGMALAGPMSADTMFHDDARMRYDVAICMYHDQALIPIKTIDFAGGSANFNAGTQFIGAGTVRVSNNAAFAGAFGTLLWLVTVCALRALLHRTEAPARAAVVLAIGARPGHLAVLTRRSLDQHQLARVRQRQHRWNASPRAPAMARRLRA